MWAGPVTCFNQEKAAYMKLCHFQDWTLRNLYALGIQPVYCENMERELRHQLTAPAGLPADSQHQEQVLQVSHPGYSNLVKPLDAMAPS